MIWWHGRPCFHSNIRYWFQILIIEYQVQKMSRSWRCLIDFVFKVYNIHHIKKFSRIMISRIISPGIQTTWDINISRVAIYSLSTLFSVTIYLISIVLFTTDWILTTQHFVVHSKLKKKKTWSVILFLFSLFSSNYLQLRLFTYWLLTLLSRLSQLMH